MHRARLARAAMPTFVVRKAASLGGSGPLLLDSSTRWRISRKAALSASRRCALISACCSVNMMSGCEGARVTT